MNPIDLLAQSGDIELTPEQEALITGELAQAYRMDECAATSPDIQRLAEKVRQRLALARLDAPEPSPPGDAPPA